MDKNQRNIKLVIVICLIVGTIFYIESSKPNLSVKTTDIVVKNIRSDQTVQGQSGTTSDAQTFYNFRQRSQTSSTTITDRTAIQAQKTVQYPRAKEFVDPTGFINTNTFRLSDIVGMKVVLLDFWTYSCINCERTIPYLNAWYQKYKDLGLEIVGVHTPEFDFEKDFTNVSNAVKQLGIMYPVVMDSNQGTWNAYQNLYWPHEYLIDIDGFIVHDKIGEGDYDKTEQAIQQALEERNVALGLGLTIPTTIVNPSGVISMDSSKVASQETYFGAMRNQFLGNGNIAVTGDQTLKLPSQQNVAPNTLYLEGMWNFHDEYAESSSTNAKIEFSYNAKNVYFVASSNTGLASSANGVTVKVFEDGILVKTLKIKEHQLYTLIQGQDYGKHTILIEVDEAGLQAFTFTFG